MRSSTNMFRNELVFLDSSMILRYLSGDELAKQIILDRSIAFAINDVVVNEIAFGAIRRAFEKAFGRYLFFELKELVRKRDPKILIGYELVEKFLTCLEMEQRFVYLPITKEMASESLSIARNHGLLPNDALIVATCRFYGITTIATFDEDFKRIPWLRVVP